MSRYVSDATAAKWEARDKALEQYMADNPNWTPPPRPPETGNYPVQPISGPIGGPIAGPIDPMPPSMSNTEGLMSPGIYEGQEVLYQGQQGLGMGQQNLAQGQVDLGLQGQQSTQALQEAVGGVQTGVTGVQQSVGQAATGEAPATGLYAGQSGIMSSQQAMGQELGQDLGGVSADMANYQRAMEAYQRGADTSRANIQQAGVQGREQIQRGIGDVGIQANRAAEQMAVARQRMMNTPQGAALFRSAGGVPQQAAQYAQTARNFQGTQQPQQISGPLGPVVTDPRTGLMGQ